MCAIFIGIMAFLLAFYMRGLLQLFLLVSSFYLPVVTVPFLLAIFGFRTSSTSVLAGIASGLIVVLIWRMYIMHDTGIDSVIPGMITNIIFLFGTHYLLAQPGGWIGIKDYSDLYKLKQIRKDKVLMLIQNIKNFNFFAFCQKNTPKQESTYTFFGIFCIVFVFSTMYSMPSDLRTQYSGLIKIIYHSVLIMSSIFLTYPIWPTTFRHKSFISIFWMLGLFYTLVFVGVLQIIISNFGQFQLMIFLLGTVVLSILVHWQTALFLMVTGIFFSIQFFKYYVGVSNLSVNLGDIQFKIIYVLLLLSSILIAFLKPKQEHLEATEQKVGTLETEVIHYNQRISDQEKEIERLGATAQKILNNVNHELRLPIGNVVNFSEMLNEGLEKYSKSQLKELSDEVLKNSTRLSSMILNMLDLATLSARTIELQKKTVNLGLLVEERIKTCRNIYLQKKKIDFELSIAQNLLIDVDPNYIRQTVDNLVINAITFSEKGVIKIILTKQQNVAVFVITNEGKPIPHTELHDIFTAFRMASNTESKAEGR